MAMVSYSPAEYEGKVIPGWAEFLGWMMTLGPVFCVIGGVVNTLIIKKIPVSMVLQINLSREKPGLRSFRPGPT